MEFTTEYIKIRTDKQQYKDLQYANENTAACIGFINLLVFFT